MLKRGEHTSNDARPDEKMGSESGKTHTFGGVSNLTSAINKQIKRSMAKKRRQRDRTESWQSG